TGGTEGLVNEPMKINDIEVSVLIKEDTDKVKLSFRSKGDIDVSTFARTYFSGGGHKNAAGGVSFLNLEETEDKFLKDLIHF
ncbi:MAG: bifunctional oligoribonuclease/PAP phosphatase NrnA, partial [Bacteroidetes bacterium]|nr:bifunctional oligoribonuclease/PAP phosphatase NrnA [Bacteroidota bacterium]